MSEKAERKQRYVIGLRPEAEKMIDQVRQMLQDDLPNYLKSVKVSRASAVEQALRLFIERKKNDI